METSQELKLADRQTTFTSDMENRKDELHLHKFLEHLQDWTLLHPSLLHFTSNQHSELNTCVMTHMTGADRWETHLVYLSWNISV